MHHAGYPQCRILLRSVGCISCSTELGVHMAKHAKGFIAVSVPSRLIWQKSTTSSDSGDTNCVEVAYLPTAVLVRDSKSQPGPALVFSMGVWPSFLAVVSSMAISIHLPVRGGDT